MNLKHALFLSFVMVSHINVTRLTVIADDTPVESPLPALTGWLNKHDLNDENLKALTEQSFSVTPINRADASHGMEAIWQSRSEFLKKSHQPEFDSREIVLGELRMPFWYKVFGEAPAEGRSLYISMHGGGGTTAAANDQQYENQKRLYQPREGVYLVPRAPTNTWNLWHQSHIDQFFDRLIVDMVLFENVNPDRVYIMGYSAGGDGVYQLAPRLADRLAAAAMMAGHPNESRPEGLRNIGFTIHMGAKDSAYNRNAKAEEWSKLLGALHANDPEGYIHEVVLHADRGHWMNREDAVVVPWMAQFTRNSWPHKLAWIQDDVNHSRFYWLRVPLASVSTGDRIMASVKGNEIHFEHSDAANVSVLLSDRLLNLDEAISIKLPSGATSRQTVHRSIRHMAESVAERFDRPGIYSARIEVSITNEQD